MNFDVQVWRKHEEIKKKNCKTVLKTSFWLSLIDWWSIIFSLLLLFYLYLHCGATLVLWTHMYLYEMYKRERETPPPRPSFLSSSSWQNRHDTYNDPWAYLSIYLSQPDSFSRSPCSVVPPQSFRMVIIIIYDILFYFFNKIKTFLQVPNSTSSRLTHTPAPLQRQIKKKQRSAPDENETKRSEIFSWFFFFYVI